MLSEETVIQWTGANGNRFRLAGPGAGDEGVIILPGPKGLYFTDVAHAYSSSAMGTRTWRRAVPGLSKIGFDVDISPIGKGVSANHDRWLRSWSSDELGWMSTFSTAMGWWYRRCRLTSVDFAGFDPLPQGTQLAMDVVADSPYWYGFTQPGIWRAPTSSATRFVFGDIGAVNRGDSAAWAKYLLPGPGQWRISDSGSSTGYVTMPRIEAGETLLVDTNEERPTVKTLDGRNRWAEVDGRFTQSFAPTVGDVIETREIGLLGGTADQKATITITPTRRWPL